MGLFLNLFSLSQQSELCVADWCHHMEQSICANCMICCTTAVSGNLDSCWDAPDNLVCSSQTFFFNPSVNFLDIQTMDTNTIPKQALQYRPKGRRNIGRPKKRWRDQLHFEDQGTGNTPNPSGTWLWWWIFWIMACWNIVDTVQCLEYIHMQCFGNWLSFCYQMLGREVSHCVPIRSFLPYNRSFPKWQAWKMLRW